MKTLKSLLKKLPFIGKLASLTYSKFKPYDIDSLSYWIDKYLPNKPIKVVQIGANDGLRGDPLHNFVLMNTRWKVLFVEPVPYLFKRLKENYGTNPRFSFENVALNENGANQIFYSVKEEAFEQIPNLSLDYDQIGSFYKENILKLSKGRLEGYITEEEVECLTLKQLIEKHNIKNIDFLYIDAEGYDWKILSQLNLENFSPLLILYEYINLEPSEVKDSIHLLKDSYHIISFRIDYLCIKKSIIKSSDLDALKRKRMILS